MLKSIRFQMQVWHGLILVTVLAGFGFTAYQIAQENLMRRVDQELDRSLGELFRPPPPPDMDAEDSMMGPPPPGKDHGGPPHGPPHHKEFDSGWLWMRQNIRSSIKSLPEETNGVSVCYYVFWESDSSQSVVSKFAPTDVVRPERDMRESRDSRPQEPEGFLNVFRSQSAAPKFTTVRMNGGRRELYVFLPTGDCLLVGKTLTAERAELHRVELLLISAGGAILLLGLAGGWWVATRAIRPIEDISATAEKISAGDLSQRIDAADTGNELGRLAEVLNSTFARLETSFAQQARFTADASHELRTPISVILSQAQLALSRERSAAEYRETLQACQRAAQRMRKLSESLLALARLDAGQEPMRPDRLDLATVAHEGVELIMPLAVERGVRICCDLAEAPCYGDAEQLGQVMSNLLANAIYFNHKGGEIRISTRLDRDDACLEIADTGEGIPEEDLPHIFERFYRVDKARSGSEGRSGLGLSICKAIVEGHGGTITVTSQRGIGSSFVVRI